jgi:hypothetical protein
VFLNKGISFISVLPGVSCGNWVCLCAADLWCPRWAARDSLWECAKEIKPRRPRAHIMYIYRMGHEKVARVKANNMRSRTASGWGGGMLTARLLTNCSITQLNILTPERISQGHVQTGGGILFRGPFCISIYNISLPGK